MPITEQRSRLIYMQRRIAGYNVFKWVNDLLDCLIQVKKDQEELKVNHLKESTIQKMLKEFKASSKRSILLDYDGTLTPYQKMPSLAVPSEELIRLLKQLTADPANEIIIISGRDAQTLDIW